MKRGVRLLLATLVAGIALVLAFHGVSFEQFGGAVAGADWGPLVIATSLVVLLILARILRWAILVRQLQPVPTGQLFAIASVGFMAIDLLPLRMGEFVRPVLLTRNAKMPFGAGTASIVVERMLDLIAAGTCLLVALLLADMPEIIVTVFDTPVDLAVQGRNVILLAMAVLGGPVVVLGLAGPRGIALLMKGLDLLPAAIGGKILGLVASFGDAVRAMASPRVAASTLGLTAVAWGCNLVGLWFTLRAFGVEIGMAEANVVMLTVTIALMLPAPVGGLGVYEAGAVAGAMLYGVPQATASAFALSLHGTHFLPVIVFGLLCIGSLGIGVRQLWALPGEASEHAEAPDG